MSEEENVVQAAYLVAINIDGSITTTPFPVGASINPFQVEREASTFDVLLTSKEIVSNIEGQLLADRIAKAVSATLIPKDETAKRKSRILQALDDRGIKGE
jgi:hypothetical protein